jgi:type I restriction enzyme S subunit
MLPKDWRKIKPSRVIKLFSGYSFDSQDSRLDGAKWLKIANVGIGEIKWDNKSFLPLSYINKYRDFLLQAPDIVIAMTRPTLGNRLKIAQFKSEDGLALLNQRIAKLVCSEEAVQDFIYQLFSSEYIAYKINTCLFGTDPPNLSVKVLDEFFILLPPFQEQQKIAKILSTWDKAIEALEKLIAAKQLRKKALMQHVLKKKIKNFANHLQATTISEISLAYFRGVAPKYSARNASVCVINQKCIRDGKVSTTYARYHDLASLVSSDKFLKDNDICINCTGTGTAGRVGLWIKPIDNNTYFADTHVMILRLDLTKASPIFINELLNESQVQNKIFSECIHGGTNQIELNRSDFGALMIKIPSLINQQKIASILSTADVEIELHQKQLQALNQQKKALMQQLLTGKKRVKLKQEE